MNEYNKDYLFQSERLGFRIWTDKDILPMAAINADTTVMEFFPALQTSKQTSEFILRMNNMFARRGFCYFAVDLLESNEFIGFIGMAEQVYEADFTPCIDIGWRLNKHYWNKGLATEGAKQCISYAFENIKLETIFATAPIINIKSQVIMQKIGMRKLKNFFHPRLIHSPELYECVVYEISHR